MVDVLEVRNVAKAFGRRRVLRDVNFSLRRGEMVGIVGENGSGKTTMLKIIVGLLSPSAGEVSVREKVGYCPQEMLVFETLTVDENFAYFAAAYGLRQGPGTDGWRDRERFLLSRFRFAPYKDMLVSNLSGGTRQKLNLSLAVLHEPGLLILDEPYSGFDWETYLYFWEYAAALKAAGACFLVVSHFLYDRGKFDKVYELREGVLRCA
ncbi:MAG: ABC transporter ATP-binding protein [Candidatus Aminicenantes bacterium]|nr:ABC transporter ATP-binding protein [Candidatus Aminicenantes bacterium]